MKLSYPSTLIAATLRDIIETSRRERPGDRALNAGKLAKAAGVAYPTFYRYLKAQRDIPAVTLFALLDYLGVTPEHFGRMLSKSLDAQIDSGHT